MGLTRNAVGRGAVDAGLEIRRQTPSDTVVALAGNPNVGKSTVFNALTGMNQHTGNWPGKTVANAQGVCTAAGRRYILVDIPGTYSLMAHSAEEEVARNFICFGGADAVAVVCDATCLERNLNLVLQTMEITPNVVVCVNLMDEAKRKGIRIDLAGLQRRLGVTVVGVTARKGRTLSRLTDALGALTAQKHRPRPLRVRYSDAVENAVSELTAPVESVAAGRLDARWVSLRLLEEDAALNRELEKFLGTDLTAVPEVRDILLRVREDKKNFAPDDYRDSVVSSLVKTAAELCRGVVRCERTAYSGVDRKVDRVLTSRRFGYPMMLALLALVFWLTLEGANVPSALLSKGLFRVQGLLYAWMGRAGAPEWLRGMLVLGVYRVLAWVVSVMLPPMAIFFPLFTLLEDAGYLPRVAYNLDCPFRKCRACGKQALTM